MKTLIIGAGPIGSLYTYLLKKAGKDVTILARNAHYDFLKENGIVLINEYTNEKFTQGVNVINQLGIEDYFDLVVVIMRKNSLKTILPDLSKCLHLGSILFLGNNTKGFDEYLDFLPREKVLFGFPGGGGARLDHIVHYVDSEEPGGPRLPLTIGEINNKVGKRTLDIQRLFSSSGIPTNIVGDIDSWLKYHVAFVIPLAGALLRSGDNYKLAMDSELIKTYIHAVREGGKVLKALGFTKSYNTKFKLFYIFPASLLVQILKKVLNTKFAETAMMMHANSAKDEICHLGLELKSLAENTSVETPNLNKLIGYVSEETKEKEVQYSNAI